MSDYYLADQRAEERAQARRKERTQRGSQDVKVTLLGDFLFSSSGEPQGCDPYNSNQGKSARDAWRGSRPRR